MRPALVPPSLWAAALKLACRADWPPRDREEATAFIDYAIREGLFPLLASEPDLPASVTSALASYRALAPLYKRRYELTRGGMLELIRIVGSESFIVLKGSDYRFRVYPQPELRPADDIDVLVPREKFVDVTRRLAEAGHDQLYSAHGAQWSPAYHEYSCQVADVHMELHRSLAQPIRAAIRYDDLWNRRERFTGDRYSAFRLAPSDAVVCHAVSLAKDEFSARLVRYLDMYLLLRECRRDLARSIDTAREWGTERALYGALHLTRSLFPDLREIGVDSAEESLLTARTRARVQRILPDPRFEASGHTRGRWIQLWRKFWLMDRVWRRFAFFGHHAFASAVGHGRESLTRRRQRQHKRRLGPEEEAGAVDRT